MSQQKRHQQLPPLPRHCQPLATAIHFDPLLSITQVFIPANCWLASLFTLLCSDSQLLFIPNLPAQCLSSISLPNLSIRICELACTLAFNHKIGNAALSGVSEALCFTKSHKWEKWTTRGLLHGKMYFWKYPTVRLFKMANGQIRNKRSKNSSMRLTMFCLFSIHCVC